MGGRLPREESQGDEAVREFSPRLPPGADCWPPSPTFTFTLREEVKAGKEPLPDWAGGAAAPHDTSALSDDSGFGLAPNPIPQARAVPPPPGAAVGPSATSLHPTTEYLAGMGFDTKLAVAAAQK